MNKKVYKMIVSAIAILVIGTAFVGCGSTTTSTTTSTTAEAVSDTASEAASSAVTDTTSSAAANTTSGTVSDTKSNATSEDIETEYHDMAYWKSRHQVEEYHPNQEITDGNYDEDVAVKCKNGTFVGFVEDDVKTWKGIPYAEQPVGDLRFKAPQEAEESDKVFEAKYYGHSCIQPVQVDEPASMYEQGEDCLYLNVWSSTKNTDTEKPVLVYIHGGGWAWGGAADPHYDGELFAHYNPEVVVVTIQYRSGILGHINFDAPDEDGNPLFEDGAEFEGSTSNGLKDMIQALKWINENIEGFGGDKDNITISGESAGSGACSALVTIPEAKQYFQKAIMMSGGINQSYSIEQTYNLSRSIKNWFTSKGKEINSVKDLQAISTEEMAEYVTSAEAGGGMNDYTYYVRDDIVMSSDIYGEYENGSTTDITILTGSTTNEFKYYDSMLAEIDKAVGQTSGTLYNNICEAVTNYIYDKAVKNDNKEFLDAYDEYVEALKESGYEVETTGLDGTTVKSAEFYNEFMNDYYLAGINTYQAYLHTKNGGTAYLYSFNIPYDGKKAYELAAHAIDCSYLFGNFDGETAIGNNAQVDASRQYQKMITAFCINGDPSTDRYECKPFEVGKANTVVIGLEPNTYFTEDYQTDRSEAIIKLYETGEEAGYRFILAVPDMLKITLEYFSQK